jgi:hypothetical protein
MGDGAKVQKCSDEASTCLSTEARRGERYERRYEHVLASIGLKKLGREKHQ